MEALYNALFAPTFRDRDALLTTVARRLWERGDYAEVMAFVRRCTSAPDGLEIGEDTLAMAAESGLDLHGVVRTFWASERPDWAGRFTQYRWQNDAWFVLLIAMARGCHDKAMSLALLAPFLSVENRDLRDSAVTALDALHTPGARALLEERKRVEADSIVLRNINLCLGEWDLA